MACSAPIISITVGDEIVTISESDLENAANLADTVSGDGGDPTLDEYTENIGNGNNAGGTTGIQLPSDPNGSPPIQTSLPTGSPYPADASDTTQAKGGNGVQTSVTSWSGDYNEQLSPNFKLRQFTINSVFPNQLINYNEQYTIDVRFNNLKGLAVNIAETLLAKFGPFNINSGLRNKTSTPPPGLSQHITGQGMDVQFAGWSYDRYWENAAWVRDNVPFDQFIFEHSDKTGLAWFHLSYNNLGNRPNGTASKILTMYRNSYSPGLKRFG